MRPAQTPRDAFDLVISLINVCHRITMKAQQQILGGLPTAVSGVLEVYHLYLFAVSTTQRPHVRISTGHLSRLLVLWILIHVQYLIPKFPHESTGRSAPATPRRCKSSSATSRCGTDSLPDNTIPFPVWQKERPAQISST